MAQGATLNVRDYQALMKALRLAEKAQRLGIRKVLRSVGENVQRDAARNIAPANRRTAAGYKIRVRQRSIAVEQSLRKTTGIHPEWGSYQMRHALLPALYANEDDTERRMEQALDQIADRFNRGGPL